ncbi:transcription antitermination factor NusB [Kordiimonas sp. SCSIO 12603]|uniref:transcription antitermination factor NusB n=1 Tax=Kordiimonas sp. SCSIO 12603 TaxID=2829596 RepID=UPI002101F851|nr:transcription antitermination factor NusB [Kordiimonas sp. SCSIO 12603]UTW57549.1 transcription antitermination factor NusB [Kordiimonas sp. SCSIO 12603]
MAGKPKIGGPRSAARLGAVQALFQLDQGDEKNAQVISTEYIEHRLGQEIEGDQYVAADEKLFADITRGAWMRKEEWDEVITPCLTDDWPLERLEPLIRSIFRAGAYELTARPDVPTKVIINEYIDVAHAFYERAEISFVNGVLDKMAKSARA